MDNFGVLLICVGIPVILLALWIYTTEQKKKQIEEARDNYRRALEKLREKPASNDLRESALKYGRYYVALASNYKGSTFDEVGLLNDLNAIQAPVAAQVASAEPSQRDVKARLDKLALLHNDGVITKEEYETRRSQILSEL